MNPIRVQIKREPHAQDLPLPVYKTHGSAGVDLYAAIEAPCVLEPGERKLIPTGIRIALPDGYEAQVRPRSGLAIEHGIGMVNSPGTIDSDYRGEIKVILINWSSEPFALHRGDRIAQMIIAPVNQVEWQETDTLDETERGGGGFGHTGRVG